MLWADSTTGTTDGTVGVDTARAATPTVITDTSTPGIMIDATGIDTIIDVVNGTAITASITGMPGSIELIIGGAQVTPVIIAGTSTIDIEPTTKARV